MKLQGKVAVVTGGGKGIGAAICKAFAKEGARVAVADIDIDGAKETATDINATGGTAVEFHVDVGDPSTIKSMIANAAEHFGQIDCLVNNAGARIIKGFMQHSEGDWNKMLQINLSGPFHGIQEVVPHMVKQGGGAIINLCSIASYQGRPNRCAYVAAKTGLLGLTKAAAADLAQGNIRVNAIAPGMIASPFNQSFAEAADTGASWAEENARGRWGQPEDIVGAAVFLASDDADFVNGAEIKIDGGWLASRARRGEVPIWE